MFWTLLAIIFVTVIIVLTKKIELLVIFAANDVDLGLAVAVLGQWT
jgi:hypothetical protein